MLAASKKEKTNTMKRLAFLPVVLLLTLWLPQTSLAAPAWGGNCLSCHGDYQSGAVTVVDADTAADPDESATGAVDRGELPVYQLFPGQTKTLRAVVAGLEDDDVYAVELKRLRFAGVEEGGELVYTPDCQWPGWGATSGYYTEPAVAYKWGADPTVFEFDIQVEPNATPDYYDLVFAVAGKYSDGGGLFIAEEHFYLQVERAGDLDGDGDVDLGDFSTFRSCMAGPNDTVPPLACPQVTFDACDFDDDSDVDLNDFSRLAAGFTG